ncbi:hypothetical protein TNCV_2925031 [Trichonephila clavipes]|nr:hypothetical protein TNCV_2925031 [Trichonephila clavipes]
MTDKPKTFHPGTAMLVRSSLQISPHSTPARGGRKLISSHPPEKPITHSFYHHPPPHPPRCIHDLEKGNFPPRHSPFYAEITTLTIQTLRNPADKTMLLIDPKQDQKENSSSPLPNTMGGQTRFFLDNGRWFPVGDQVALRRREIPSQPLKATPGSLHTDEEK